jgi:flagellar biosynthesis protein
VRREKDHTPSYGPVKPSAQQQVAVALLADESKPEALPEIVATGRGHLAREILDIAYANGIMVREDCALAEILAQLELDTPIPSEAVVAVAEILAKVYEANNAMNAQTDYARSNTQVQGKGAHDSADPPDKNA